MIVKSIRLRGIPLKDTVNAVFDAIRDGFNDLEQARVVRISNESYEFRALLSDLEDKLIDAVKARMDIEDKMLDMINQSRRDL